MTSDEVSCVLRFTSNSHLLTTVYSVVWKFVPNYHIPFLAADSHTMNHGECRDVGVSCEIIGPPKRRAEDKAHIILSYRPKAALLST
jgi:hypothetical protein